MEVWTQQDSLPEPGAGAPAGMTAGELAGEPAAAATLVLEGTAIAVGTLETILPVSGEEDSRGTGLMVRVKATVAVGSTELASTGDGDSIGEPPKSVPLCDAVPFMG